MNITIRFCDKEYFVRGLYFGTYISLVMSFINKCVNNKPLIKATFAFTLLKKETFYQQLLFYQQKREYFSLTRAHPTIRSNSSRYKRYL